MPDTLKMRTHSEELTKKDLKLADLLEQYWLVKGHIPTQEQAAKMGLSPRLYMKNMKNTKFREQLAARGLGVEDPADPKLVSWALTDKQLAAANVMLDMLDNRSRKRKLDNLEISTQEYQAWLKDPAFQEYLRLRSEGMLKDNIHEAHAALVDRVRTGDTNAIKYYYELVGRYTPASARANNIDPMEIVQSVIEIIQSEITDKDTLKRVGNRLASLMGRAAVGHEIDNATSMAHGSYGDVSDYGSIAENTDLDNQAQETKQELTDGEEVKDSQVLTAEFIENIRDSLPKTYGGGYGTG